MSFSDVLVSIMDSYASLKVKRKVDDQAIADLTSLLRPESTNQYHDGVFMDRFVATLPVKGNNVDVTFSTRSDLLDVQPMYVWQVQLNFEGGLYFPEKDVLREAANEPMPMVYETKHGRIECIDGMKNIEFIAGNEFLDGRLTISMRGVNRLRALHKAVRAGIYDSFFKHVQYTAIDDHLEGR